MYQAKSLWRTLAAVASVLTLFAILPASASAGLLSVGDTLYPAPVTSSPVSGELEIEQEVPFTTAVYSGTLTTKVYSGDPANPLGGYTFVYQVTNNASSINVIQRLTVNDFASCDVDASYQLPGLAPAFIDRNTADTIGFSFLKAPIGLGGLTPGTTTALLVLHTNSTRYTPTQAAIIDGAVASVPSFAPGAVPEPGTMIALGIGAAALLRRRRKQA